MKIIDIDQLANVTGGVSALSFTGPAPKKPLLDVSNPLAPKLTGTPKSAVEPKLETRKVDGVKLIGNQSLDDLYWEAKPF